MTRWPILMLFAVGTVCAESGDVKTLTAAEVKQLKAADRALGERVVPDSELIKTTGEF